MILQRLIGNIYSVFLEIMLWIIPIGCIIIGIQLATEYDILPDAFIGFILGVIVGLFLDIFLFGPVIIKLNIRASLKNIEKKLEMF